MANSIFGSWVTVRIDLLAGTFTAALAFYLIYGPSTRTPSAVGFSLNMAATFSGMILMWVRFWNDLEGKCGHFKHFALTLTNVFSSRG
jgi:hypothetical protein